MTTTTTASKRPEEAAAAEHPHAAPEEQPHASLAQQLDGVNARPTASTKRPPSTQSTRGSTQTAKAQDAHASGGKRLEQPHAAQRKEAWKGGGSRPSIWDAAGGGGTRGLDVRDFPQLASITVSPRKGDGPPTTEEQVEQHHAPSALPGGKKSSQTNLSAMQAAAIDEGFLADVSSNSSQLPKPPFLWNPSLWDLGHRPSVSSREETMKHA